MCLYVPGEFTYSISTSYYVLNLICRPPTNIVLHTTKFLKHDNIDNFFLCLKWNNKLLARFKPEI